MCIYNTITILVTRTINLFRFAIYVPFNSDFFSLSDVMRRSSEYFCTCDPSIYPPQTCLLSLPVLCCEVNHHAVRCATGFINWKLKGP